MINRGLMVAGAVLLLANGVILANVARNRAGNPDAVVRLSERELESWGSTPEGAEEILTLRLRWQTAPGPGDAGAWFDRARLEALGVTGLAAPSDTSERSRRRGGLYAGFVVLELGGPAWERWAAAQRAREDSTAAIRAAATEAVPELRAPLAGTDTSVASRLMAVDVGLDPLELRNRYPDRSRYLILPGTFRADRTAGDSTTPERVAGEIIELLPGRVSVPLPLRDSLLALGAARRDSTTHFQVTLKVGKRWEAWVE